VPDDELESVLGRRHVRPMDFTGRPMKGFVYVAPRGFRTAAALGAWLDRGERFVRLALAATPPARGARRRAKRARPAAR
jgi:hypothetical protein